MAYKTMLRQLISKWGIMSIEMQQAYEGDAAVIGDDMQPNYVDNDATPPMPAKQPQEADPPAEQPAAEELTSNDPFA